MAIFYVKSGSTGNGLASKIVNLKFVTTKVKSFWVASLISLSSSLLFHSPASAAGIQKLADFNGSNGSLPSASFTIGSNGLFYGTTAGGGTSDKGTIFSFNPTNNNLNNLAEFDGINGANPYASLTKGSNGLFYGTTVGGGGNNQGAIFSFNPTTHVLTKLEDFSVFSGISPFGTLIQGSNGLFYGTTAGGVAGYYYDHYMNGTIFSFNPITNVISALAYVDSVGGRYPYAGLTIGNNGLFYGTTVGGGSYIGGSGGAGGILFSLNPITYELTRLVNFDGSNGSVPHNASLIKASNGIFYGTTARGGTNDNGTIFSFNPTTNVLTKLADFDGSNGASPEASLTIGSNGLFYGTTVAGGTNNWGTIFSFNPTNNILTKLAGFDGSNGSNPYGSLMIGSNGLFYGTTQRGGINDLGTIFSFSDGSATNPNDPPPPVATPEASNLWGLGLFGLGLIVTSRKRK